MIASASSAAPPPAPGLDIEILFASAYRTLAKHKSIAVGPLGTYWLAYGEPSAARAQKRALTDCNRKMARSFGAKAQEKLCAPFAVDNRIVWNKPLVGIPVDRELAQPDIPLQKGYWLGDRANPKKILLAVYGCNRPGARPPDAIMSWYGYFASRGFLVVQPDPFAAAAAGEPMAEVCGAATPANFEDFVAADKLRVAQAKRTLRELRKSYGDIPIYIWSHSAGGRIAQAFEADVSGIIVSGTECGLGNPLITMIRKDVPILHVFGEKDPTLARMADPITEKTVKGHCGGRSALAIGAGSSSKEPVIRRQSGLNV